MRLFENKLGREMPLKFVLGYKDMKIKFVPSSVPGMYSIEDDCVTFEFTLRFYAFHDFADPEFEHLKLSKKELFYDEIPFKVTGNLHMLGE